MVPIDHFDTAAERHLAEPALIDDGVVVTFEELMGMSWRVAGFVSQFACTAEDPVPVAVYSPNDYRVLVAMLGIMRAGGVIVPLHSGNDLSTSVDFLTQVQPKCLFFHKSLASQARRIREQVPSLEVLVCLDDDSFGPSLGQMLREPQLQIIDWIDASGNRSRPMYYWSTSGSTGTPKVVVEDCGNFDVMLRASRQRRDRLLPPGTAMSLAPLSHGGGPSAIAMLTLGGTCLISRAFDPFDVLEKIQRYKVTELWLSPTALTLLVDYPTAGSYDLSSLRTVLLGAAGISADKLRRAVELFGPCIAHSYGQSETSFITFFDARTLGAAVQGDHPERLRSSGRTMGVNRVAIANMHGTLLPPGESGEVVVRGACVKRYLDEEITAASRRGGWHRTGDIGYLDAEGFLYVTGRLKDVINMAGFKIPAVQLERVIEELEVVRECVVVAAPDSVRGEVIRAVVTSIPGHVIDIAVVRSYCQSKLGPGGTPQIVEVWDELPRTPAGKIDKERIRNAFSSPPEAR